MFAVPGWAVSADSLKAETSKASAPPPPPPPGPNEPTGGSNQSKKRKRQSAPSNVTAANVADLWEQVIEGKSGKKPKTAGDSSGAKGSKKKQKQKNGHVKGNAVAEDGDEEHSTDATPQLSRDEKKKAKKEKKKKKLKDENHGENPQGEDVSGAEREASTKKSKKGKKNKRPSDSQGDGGEGQKDTNDKAKPQTEEEPDRTTAAAAPPAPKLTPLQAAMREKLISARFRHLNETLYTRPSAEAFQLFQESPEMFQEYHEGFRRQVDVWPENPVDGYIREIQVRGRQKPPPPPPPTNKFSKHGNNNNNNNTSPGPAPPTNSNNNNRNSEIAPLPRTNGTCTIADLGCGDAKLAAALDAEKRRLRVEVASYDLHGAGPRVTRADVSRLPRADGSVDVAVFCLALMGTNWLDFVEEAYRVLRWRGELWVAEIKSRFSGPGPASASSKAGAGAEKKNGVVSHSVGNRRKVGAVGGGGGGKKGGKKDQGDAADDGGGDHETDLAVEVDGAEDRRGETDVSGFVEALRRRGFVLQGEPDLRNKMFVRMRFVKAAPATVGKCASKDPPPPGRFGGNSGGGGGLVQKRNALKKFLDDGAEDKVDESGILKPCVYKIR